MVDYQDSSHLNQWLFVSTDQMQECRSQANHDARVWLVGQDSQSIERDTGTSTDTETTPKSSSASAPTALFFACGYNEQKQKSKSEQGDPMTVDYAAQGPTKNGKGHEFLTPAEESTLISFYASKLATLIGPKASVPRLRRESKVTATAALLYRRFFLSNSVMIFGELS